MKYTSSVTDDYRHACPSITLYPDGDNVEWSSEPFELNLPGKNKISIYIIDETDDGPVTHHVIVCGIDETENMVNQISSYYTGHCPFKVTGMTCAYKQEGFFPGAVEISDELQEILDRIPIDMDNYESEKFIVCLNSDGDTVRTAYMQPN